MDKEKEIIPGEDFMTIIMGLGGPDEPGHHGREKLMGMPHESCCEFIAKIRDMCDEFLMNNAGKDEDKSSKNKRDSSEEDISFESDDVKEEI